jgi:hypothetical protein
MATKTNLISNINSFITAIVTVAKHRNSMLEIVNEFYRSPLKETNFVNSITDNNSVVGLAYDITLMKQGGKVTINGSITNTTSEIIASVSEDSDWFFQIVNSEYFPTTLDNSPFIAYNGIDSLTYVFFANNKLYCRSIAPSDTVYFQFTYFLDN